MKYFPVSILAGDELHVASDRIDKIIAVDLAADPFAAVVQPKLRAAIVFLGQALGKDTGSGFTDVLEKKDEDRDAAFIGLRNYIQAFAPSRDAAKANAAALLLELIQNRGASLHSLGYAAQSSQLVLLLNDLQTPEAQAALATIGVETWATALQTAQDGFEAAYQEKVKTESGLERPKVGEAFKKVGYYQEHLLSYIECMVEFNPGLFQPVADKLDEVTADTIAVARSRRTRKVNEKTKEGEPEEGEPKA